MVWNSANEAPFHLKILELVGTLDWTLGRLSQAEEMATFDAEDPPLLCCKCGTLLELDKHLFDHLEYD